MKRLFLQAAVFLLMASTVVQAETIRIALFNVGLERDGPGLLLDALHKGKDPQILAVQKIITEVRPNVLVLNGFDQDADNFALKLFVDQLAAQGLNLQYVFSKIQNMGIDSHFDLNNDGYLGDNADAFGYADFPGQGGMAVLSEYPILEADAQDFTSFLWRDLPRPSWPMKSNGDSFHSDEEKAVLPLHATGAWIVPIDARGGVFSVLVSHSNPPVFDGAEDANGKRNLDQLRFWDYVLAGDIGMLSGPFVMTLGLNADPWDGDGASSDLRSFLQSDAITDPMPTSKGAAASEQTGEHKNPANQDTVDWREPSPGNLRVDYVLPSGDFAVKGSGVFWPQAPAIGYDWVVQAQNEGTRHKMVWVDVELPQIDRKP